eukprot:3380555-Pyramimonas_sp.AAC.1
MRSRAPGATFQMCMRHLLQAQPAFHCCCVQSVGITSHGGGPVCSLRGAPGSGRRVKQPSAGLPAAHTSSGDPGGQ